MTVTYALLIETALSLEAVLELIFKPKTIAPLEGTDMLYARGTVFLAHAQQVSAQMQNRHASLYNFPPTLSIRYFPDGVSSVNTAMDLLVEGIGRFLNETDDNCLLTANKIPILKRLDGQLTITSQHDFWRSHRLKMINLPYSED